MIHPRSDWTSRDPASSTKLNPAAVKGVAVHWLGPAADSSDVPRLLRGIQSFHMGTRKWADIAYNLAVDQAGDVWVLRGTDVRSAANGDATSNSAYVAVVCLIGEGQEPSAEMIRGLRDAVALVRHRYPAATVIAGHQDVRPDPTACPGPTLAAAVRAGDLDPSRAVAPDTAIPWKVAMAQAAHDGQPIPDPYFSVPGDADPAPPPPPAPPAPAPVLRRGDRGDAVRAWQVDLNAYTGAGLRADGDFGPATEQATKAFQRFMGGMAVDGIVGPKTRSVMEFVKSVQS